MANGIRPSIDKVNAIKLFREPAISEEVRGFLGLVNFVGKFIPNLATITAPLRSLTHHNTPFKWTNEQESAFTRLKNHLSHSSILGYYNKNDRTQIILLVLALYSSNSTKQIYVSYHMQVEVYQQRNKSTRRQKRKLWHWFGLWKDSIFTFGKEFELITDHKPLETIFAPKTKPCCRIERWVLGLQL